MSHGPQPYDEPRDPIPPGHGENVGPGPMPRCPTCFCIVVESGDPKGNAKCQAHGWVRPVYGRLDDLWRRANREAALWAQGKAFDREYGPRDDL